MGVTTRKREKETDFVCIICWFTPQMFLMAKAELCQSKEAGNPSKSLT